MALQSVDFFNEIHLFKIRLETLERERYELEDKVRRLQVSRSSQVSSLIVFIF